MKASVAMMRHTLSGSFIPILSEIRPVKSRVIILTPAMIDKILAATVAEILRSIALGTMNHYYSVARPEAKLY